MKDPQQKLPPIVNFAAVDFWYHNRAHSEIQLMTRLSRQTRVLFVNSIGMRAPMPGRSSNSGFRIIRKIKSLMRGLRKPLAQYPNFYVFSPIIIPAYSTPWLRSINFTIIRLQVRVVMAWLRIKKPIIVQTIPTANEISPRLPHIIEIVNRVDKMSAFSETDQSYIESLEKDQISRAQRTYYTSQLLLEDEQAWHNGKGQFLDHGVNLDLFTPGVPPPISDISDMSEMGGGTPGKIIGFFGGIDDYVIDLILLEKVAREFPQCTLLLIGEATCNIDDLLAYDNVVSLGLRSIEDVARIGSHFDVAILPRNNDEWTRYTNPIKIKEYLALGLEVVSTDIPEIRRYKDDIHIVSSHDEFLSAIKQVLAQPRDNIRSKHLRSLVETDTWDVRAAEVSNDMKELIACVE